MRDEVVVVEAGPTRYCKPFKFEIEKETCQFRLMAIEKQISKEGIKSLHKEQLKCHRCEITREQKPENEASAKPSPEEPEAVAIVEDIKCKECPTKKSEDKKFITFRQLCNKCNATRSYRENKNKKKKVSPFPIKSFLFLYDELFYIRKHGWSIRKVGDYKVQLWETSDLITEVGQVNPGTKVCLLKKSASRLLVRCPEGQRGWISEKQIDISKFNEGRAQAAQSSAGKEGLSA
jgi:hypothetical protein